MTHEHINSTPAPHDPETGKPLERVTVRWTRAEELPGGELATGDITLATEWLKTDVRFPSPELFDVRTKYQDGKQVGQWITAHTYGASEPQHTTQVDDLPCAYCGLPEDSNCHAGGETYCDLGSPASEHSTLPAVHVGRSGTGGNEDIHSSPRTSPWTPDPTASTYRDAIQTVHREGAPTWSEPCTGFWVTLTRDDANRLIRKLRRAVQESSGGDA